MILGAEDSVMIYLLPLTVKVKKLALEQSESPVTNDMQAEAKEVLVEVLEVF